MARFPYYKKNVTALGKLLAHAATNKGTLARLKKDPSSCLAEIGFPQQTTTLIDFQIVEQSQDLKAVALPYKLNAEKLRRKDKDYLCRLSSLFHLN